MRTIVIAGGRMEAGPGWERDGETSLVRRALRIEARLAARTTLAPPLRHLAVTATERSGDEILDALRGRLTGRVPRLSVLREGRFVFADGGIGRCLAVEMELIAGLPSRQLHVVRTDAGVTHHFVATVAGLDASALERELLPMIESFYPTGPSVRSGRADTSAELESAAS